MNKMKLSQNESNEAVCSCDSVCPYLHRLVRKYGNTKNKDKDLGIKKYFRYWRAESVKALEEAGRYRAFQEHIKIMEVLDKLGVLGV